MLKCTELKCKVCWNVNHPFDHYEKGKDGLHYPMPEDELDEDVLTEFVEDFIAGKAKPFIKSKPIPKKQGPVIEVVGKSFNSVVMDKDKVTHQL